MNCKTFRQCSASSAVGAAYTVGFGSCETILYFSLFMLVCRENTKRKCSKLKQNLTLLDQINILPTVHYLLMALYVTAHFGIGYRPFSLYENSSNLIYSVMKKYVWNDTEDVLEWNNASFLLPWFLCLANNSLLLNIYFV